MVVPDHRYTFDHTRALTPPAHMIDDYDRGTTSIDGTHLSDYLDGLDWSRWDPAGTPEQNAATREQLRAAYLAESRRWQEEIDRQFKRLGIDKLALRTDEEYLPVLHGFFKRRVKRAVA
jgi:hypothetical protein